MESIRHETPTGVAYEVLNSAGTQYHWIDMLDGKALGCGCKFSKYNPTCKHQQEAERQEKLHQASLQGGIGERGSLNYSDKGFRVLR
jgi:hypothetical protein